MIRQVIFVMAVIVSSLAPHPDLWAQYDLKGCSEYGVDVRNPQSIESTLWTFRSNVWDGYIDFQENGKYWTHWGFGTWTVNADGETIHLANDYNDRTYEVAFTDSGYRFQGMRNDGLSISGKLICAKYQGPGPEVPQEVEKKIKTFFKSGFERDPEKNELIAQYRLYLQGKTVEEIIEGMKSSPEYLKKQAERAAKLKEMEEKGLIQW